MGIEDVKDKYGKNRDYKSVMNKAIRHEIAGGNELIDAIAMLDNLGFFIDKLIEETRIKEELKGVEILRCIATKIGTARKKAAEAKERMSDEIKIRYGMTIEQPSKNSEELPG